MTNDHSQNENKVMKNGAGSPAVCLNVKNELQTTNFDIEFLLKEFVSLQKKKESKQREKTKKKRYDEMRYLQEKIPVITSKILRKKDLKIELKTGA